MNLRTAWAQVFGVAAILVALAFAPSAAQAHAGHVHTGSAPVAASVDLPSPAVSVDTLSVRPDRTLLDHDAAELWTAPDAVPAAQPGVCGQGCCTGAPCHGCTACTLGPDISFLLPADAGESLMVWNVTGIAGCDPEGIRKPPKFFA